MFRTIPMEAFMALPGSERLSDWLTVDQKRIDTFADATDDHQFIHVDPERAAETPMGGTIAHGFLTLSLLSRFTAETVSVPEGYQMTYNYGMNKVRFLEPVKVDSRIRARAKTLEITEKQPGRFLVCAEITVEIEGREKPALVAESLMMHFVDTGGNS